MAHTLRKANLGNSAFAQIVITDYVAGGEPFTLAEFGITGALVGVDFINIVGQANLTPVFVAPNKVQVLLPTATADPGPEVPPTIGLNFKFVAIVNGT